MSLPGYDKQAAALMDDDERSAMEFFIATTAADHPVIPETGGFRKARWALPGRGKSGGLRVIYFLVTRPGQVFMAAIYRKSDQDNLSAADRRKLAAVAKGIKAELTPKEGTLQ